MEKNYYDILAIDKNATQQQISEAFKKLSLKYHPDRNGGKKYYEELFKEINEANQVLSDEFKRVQYNYSLKQIVSNNTNTSYSSKLKALKLNSNKIEWLSAILVSGVIVVFFLIIANKSLPLFSKRNNSGIASNIPVFKKYITPARKDKVAESFTKKRDTLVSEITDTVNKKIIAADKAPESGKADDDRQIAVANKVQPEQNKFKKNETELPKRLSDKQINNQKAESLLFKKVATKPERNETDQKNTKKVRLSLSQMAGILTQVHNKKAVNSKMNCVKIIVTNTSNITNAFEVANYLRGKGLIISGRETIKSAQTGIKITAGKDCISITIGSL